MTKADDRPKIAASHLRVYPTRRRAPSKCDLSDAQALDRRGSQWSPKSRLANRHANRLARYRTGHRTLALHQGTSDSRWRGLAQKSCFRLPPYKVRPHEILRRAGTKHNDTGSVGSSGVRFDSALRRINIRRSIRSRPQNVPRRPLTRSVGRFARPPLV